MGVALWVGSVEFDMPYGGNCRAGAKGDSGQSVYDWRLMKMHCARCTVQRPAPRYRSESISAFRSHNCMLG